MTSDDISFFRLCHEKGWVSDPLLDIGSSTFDGAQTSFSHISKDLGLKEIMGVDLAPGTGVDRVFDFSINDADFKTNWGGKTFRTVVVFNVLEHTFDPYQVLRNASRCVKSGGYLLTLVPVIWPIHSFPKDHCRLLPDWFEEFAKREGFTIIREGFLWLSQFGMKKVDHLTNNGERVFPSFHLLGKSSNPARYWLSKLSHRLLNTFGRNHLFTHTAIGVALKKD